jgi:pimeloyl-ACP methyl ester carboxylesterase
MARVNAHIVLALDRAPGTLWGDAWTANFQPSTLGHYTTLRSWLSQWSLRCSRGDGPAALREVTVPVLVIYGTADQGCFPSHARALYGAATHRGKRLVALEGGRHYLNDQPELIRRMTETVWHWLDGVLG